MLRKRSKTVLICSIIALMLSIFLYMWCFIVQSLSPLFFIYIPAFLGFTGAFVTGIIASPRKWIWLPGFLPAVSVNIGYQLSLLLYNWFSSGEFYLHYKMLVLTLWSGIPVLFTSIIGALLGQILSHLFRFKRK
jgi:hypothetical protein